MIKFPAVSLPITSAYWITIYYVLIGCSIQSHEWRLAGSEEEDRNNATQRYNLMAHPVFNTQKKIYITFSSDSKNKERALFFSCSLHLARALHSCRILAWIRWLTSPHCASEVRAGEKNRWSTRVRVGKKKMFYDTKRKRWITRERETSNRRRANRRQCNNW